MLVQGITGREGQYHTKGMLAAATPLVAGVTPGKGGLRVEGVPVFDTVVQARAATGANVSCIFVPPLGAADAIMESAAAGMGLVVCITEFIPVNDMARAAAFLKELSHDAADRAKLPRIGDARRGQGWHHAVPHLQRGPRRFRLALGHADL